MKVSIAGAGAGVGGLAVAALLSKTGEHEITAHEETPDRKAHG